MKLSDWLNIWVYYYKSCSVIDILVLGVGVVFSTGRDGDSVKLVKMAYVKLTVYKKIKKKRN